VREVQVEVDGEVVPISRLAFEGTDGIFEFAWGADRFVTSCMFIGVTKRAGLDERRDAGFVAGMMRVSVNMNIDHVKDVIDDGGGVVPVGSVREEEINERNAESINVVHVDSSLRGGWVVMKVDEEFPDFRVEGSSGHDDRLEGERLERRGESRARTGVMLILQRMKIKIMRMLVVYDFVLDFRWYVSCIIVGFCVVFGKFMELRF